MKKQMVIRLLLILDVAKSYITFLLRRIRALGFCDTTKGLKRWLGIWFCDDKIELSPIIRSFVYSRVKLVGYKDYAIWPICFVIDVKRCNWEDLNVYLIDNLGLGITALFLHYSCEFAITVSACLYPNLLGNELAIF